jgi:hypothetical protein
MSLRAEKQLQSTNYTVEKRRWNFEKFVKVHKDQHTILQGLVEHDYAGIDNRSKVCHLLNGSKSMTLDTVKTCIMADATLRNDFDACVNLFQDLIEQWSSSEVREVLISAVKTHGGGGNDSWNDIAPDVSVPDWYYTKPEHAKLSQAKKLGLKKKLEKRGGPPPRGISPHQNRKDPREKGIEGSGIHLSNRSIKALVSAMKDDATEATSPEDESSSEDDEEKAMSPTANKNTQER